MIRQTHQLSQIQECRRKLFYLLVARAGEGVLDRMCWVSALLVAEAPLGGGVARAAGHPGSVLAAAADSETLARPCLEKQTTCSKTKASHLLFERHL